MATRRCFHCKIVLSDAFQALSDEAQLLYFRLCMAADDDGFLNNARSLSQGCPDALEELTARRFVLRIGDICVIKHWRISNSLKNDRLKPLAHPEAAQRIWVCGNRAYTDHAVAGCITLYELKTGEKPRFLVESTGIPTEENRTEENRTEPNRTEAAPTRAEADFRQILAEYPAHRIGSRDRCAKAFKKHIRCQEDGATALKHLRLWIKSEQWTKEEGRYVPSLKNWLEHGTWQFRPPPDPVPKGASGQLGEAELEAIARVLQDQEVSG